MAKNELKKPTIAAIILPSTMCKVYGRPTREHGYQNDPQASQ